MILDKLNILRECYYGETSEKISVKLSENQKNRLDEICKIENRPMSWVVRDVLDKWMNEYKEDAEK